MVLRPLFFTIYINFLGQIIPDAPICLSVDDTGIFAVDLCLNKLLQAFSMLLTWKNL